MSNETKEWVKCVVTAIVTAAVMWIAARAIYGIKEHRRNEDESVVTRIDTVRVRDTVTIRDVVTVERAVVDTMYVAATDTIHLNDTVYIRMPREQKKYGSDLYDLWISGYSPQMDSLKLYPVTEYITERETIRDNRRFGIGINVGYGATITDRSVMLAPYIGIGVSYNIFAF